MSPLEKAIWLAVIVACLAGGLAFAMWYARRQKTRRETPIITPGCSGFAIGKEFAGLPCVWTFPNGTQLYTNIKMVNSGPDEALLTGGITITSNGTLTTTKGTLSRRQALVLLDPDGKVLSSTIGSHISSR